MYGGSPGGLHHGQRPRKESETSSVEEMVLPGWDTTGNINHSAIRSQLWQEFNILNLLHYNSSSNESPTESEKLQRLTQFTLYVQYTTLQWVDLILHFIVRDLPLCLSDLTDVM